MRLFLQFFHTCDRALRKFRRVLKPNGRVAVTTWGDDDSRWDWLGGLRTSYDAVMKLGSQTLDKPDEIQQWFSNAGFNDTQITTKELDMVYRDEEEWWNMVWSISGRAGLEK
ncbi:MAG: hypothetical protein U0X92_06210 [Anaerolineales bacterium]